MVVLTAEGQREAERRAVEKGISLKELMERAGTGLFRAISREREVNGANVIVMCGKGGNGGDGFVCARLLKQAGARVTAVLCCGEPVSEPSVGMYNLAKECGVDFLSLGTDSEGAHHAAAEADVAVDAVFGIGFRGELPDDVARLFMRVNSNPYVLRAAADMPSGVNSDTGRADERSFRAHFTVSFIAVKPAQLFKNLWRFCGRVTLEEVGVPRETVESVNSGVVLLDKSTAGVPLRDACGHKGTFGRLACVVGSELYRGAGVISVGGALRGGAGFVYALGTEGVLDAVAVRSPEAIMINRQKNPDEAVRALERADACLVGCGLGRGEDSERAVRTALGKCRGTVVVDADALGIVADDPGLFELIKNKKAIFTPHIGEFSRLSGLTADEIMEDRIGASRSYSNRHGVTLVLKSDNTVVAEPSGRVYVNTVGNPGLAKAGSGDLLAGVIASLAAMGLSPRAAACAGVLAHSRAADLACEGKSMHSLTASDVCECLGKALSELESRA